MSYKDIRKIFTFKRYMSTLNGFAVIVHSINVILLGMYHFGYDVSLRYTKTTFMDSVQNPNKISNQAFYTSHEFTTVNVVTLLMMNEGFAMISGLIGFFNTFKSNNKKIIYYETIRRWIEFGLTAAFLEVALLLALGETDMFSLISIFILIVIQQMTGYLIDTEGKNSTHTFIYFFIGFLILIYQQSFVFIKSLSTTGISDRDRIVLPLVNAVMYSLFGIHHLLHQSTNWYSMWINKHTQFILLSFCTKTIITWLTFTSLRHTVESIEPNFVEYDIDWKSSFNIILLTIIPFFVGVTFLSSSLPPLMKDDSPNLSSRSRPTQKTISVDYRARPMTEMSDGVPILGLHHYSLETDRLL